MQAKRRLSERGMSAVRRGKRRKLVPSLGTVAIALAAGLGCADAQSPPGASGSDLGVHVPILSPEAPLSFGNLADANPLFAVFIAGNIARGSTLEAETLTDSKLGLTLAAAVSEKPSAPEISPPVDYDPTAGPSLSPTQSALRASLERLVTRDDRRNPLGSGDWRAARAAIAAFYAGRFYAPVWVSETGLTDAGRAVLAQLKRARDDGLNLSALALPRDLGSGLDPDAIAEAETTIASALVAYARQATGSRVPPSHVSGLIFATPSVADPGIALAETAGAPDPAERLAQFNPPQKGYRALRDE
jgi:murein L,D-transpeptidase YcbB/YkuD